MALAVGDLDQALIDGPIPQGYGTMAARCREAVFVPEQDAEMGSRIVGRDDEAAIHVSVAAGLMAKRFAEGVERVVGRLEDGEAPLGYGLAGWEVAWRKVLDDAEGFAGCVPVFCVYP